MPILGKIDSAVYTTVVEVTTDDASVSLSTTVANNFRVGDIIDIGDVAYIVRQINVVDNNDTNIVLHKPYEGLTGAVSQCIRRTAPKAVAEYVILGGDSNNYDLVFVDNDEQNISTNKLRGLSSPGWWMYRSHSDASGRTRHKAECIAHLNVSSAIAGDYNDDSIVADVVDTITVTTSPSDSISVNGNGSFSAAATNTDSADIVYRWQRQKTNAVRWIDISANLDSSITYSTFNTNQLIYSGYTNDNHDGYKYRCVFNSEQGAPEMYSDFADLTFGIAFVSQPSNSVSVSGSGSFSVTVRSSSDAPTTTYQWQRRTSDSAAWVDVDDTLIEVVYADYNTSTLTYTTLSNSNIDDYMYRCVINEDDSTYEMISDTATISYGT